MQVIQKIKQLAEARGWTEYRLVKESGLAPSTIANIYHRNTIPTLPTLEALCNTFGITLSQFFSEDERVSLSKEQSQLLEYWSALTPEQRSALLNLLKTFPKTTF
ncbi:MAG: helix-turn-helix transcriptional regulator [Lachnospiraceae bacterium]|nr:helix-turn-helix transcriptional regulator [Lachnospiraceae bacterium]